MIQIYVYMHANVMYNEYDYFNFLLKESQCTVTT